MGFARAHLRSGSDQSRFEAYRCQRQRGVLQRTRPWYSLAGAEVSRPCLIMEGAFMSMQSRLLLLALLMANAPASAASDPFDPEPFLSPYGEIASLAVTTEAVLTEDAAGNDNACLMQTPSVRSALLQLRPSKARPALSRTMPSNLPFSRASSSKTRMRPLRSSLRIWLHSQKQLDRSEKPRPR